MSPTIAAVDSGPRRSLADGPRVHLDELVFTLSWEDPALDRGALAIAPGRHVATVASGGCNSLSFLLDDPSSVWAFDYNVTQCWLVELKIAAFRALDHEGVLELFGIRVSQRRAELFERVLPSLSPSARRYWAGQRWVMERGLLNGGRYERFVAVFRSLLTAIQGKERVAGLFVERDPEERRAYYDQHWDTWRFRRLFSLFFNKAVLSRRGLSAEYFSFDDGSRSFADSFALRARNALRELPIRDNYFVAQYLRGNYLDDLALPEYLRRENFEAIRDRLDRLRVVHADVRELFDADARFDAICLSNVFELMSLSETAEVLERVARALRVGGRLTLRNLMIPRRVPDSLGDLLKLDERQSKQGLLADRSFVYSSFQVYTRVGEPRGGISREGQP